MSETTAKEFKCFRHPDVVLDSRLECEECIAAGYTLRVQSHRIGRNRYVQTITLPQEAPND